MREWGPQRPVGPKEGWVWLVVMFIIIGLALWLHR